MCGLQMQRLPGLRRDFRSGLESTIDIRDWYNQICQTGQGQYLQPDSTGNHIHML